ncbi:YqaJ viral recombinase family protein ['Santalum album' aster yellows phytoplasma]|uniref:YqaJ viral recombinase family protein n=1 Tax='Santalum album' aster yellows phytoplasma TaxID=2831467 RepID=A0ABS5LKT0_9MOLU|nr:YqaJ viral recombinase family protein ['Santalum album' aster yellows phytoplasma]MBS2993810.1 YqaJ viral recombinase family protein ['Santalum album' aster yellows phytoplasma]
MQIKNLNQHTKLWYQHRKKYINASEIASITGLDPFRSMKQLVHDKLFGTTFTSNQYTLHGQKMEPIAREFFNQKTNLTFEDTIFTDDKVKMFSASLDGYNEKHQAVLEIKCPYVNENQAVSSTWTHFLTHPQLENIPKYYWAQVQCQLYCSQANFAYFLVYFNDQNYHVVRIYQNKTFIIKMIQDSQKYLALLNKVTEELTKTTYLKQLSKIK